MQKLSTYLGGAIMACVFICGFIAYFVTSSSHRPEQWMDGFGRPLEASPWFMQMLFGQGQLWAGWAWFLGDMAIFWGGIGIGLVLISFGSGKRDASH